MEAAEIDEGDLDEELAKKSSNCFVMASSWPPSDIKSLQAGVSNQGRAKGPLHG